ncbi:MAG: DUF3168 domain-containing protein [Hyphomicrobiaceae bacterium]|nr:MAG: DUF3168 domain-containing protein [Hyphomicrobiaceae bacterium]
MISEALYSKLSTDSGISAIVSTRVYPVRLPQNPVFPCVSFQVITEPRTYTMEGKDAPNVIFQIDCWAKTHVGAHQLAEAVSASLSGFRGTMGTGGSARYVSSCLQRNATDLFEPEVNDYRVSLDFSVWYN